MAGLVELEEQTGGLEREAQALGRRHDRKRDAGRTVMSIASVFCDDGVVAGGVGKLRAETPERVRAQRDTPRPDLQGRFGSP
jgi:hypothetical protein